MTPFSYLQLVLHQEMHLCVLDYKKLKNQYTISAADFFFLIALHPKTLV